MMTPKSSRTRFIYFIIFILAFFVVAPFILLYSFGYNWSKNFSLLKTGGVYVYSSQNGAQVYLNDKLDDTTSVFQRGVLIKDLKPDKYTVKVVKDNYIDWKKEITVKEERVAEAYPFLVPRQVVATSVPALVPKSVTSSSTMIANPEYKNLISYFATTTKNTSSKTLEKSTSTKASTTLPYIENKKLRIEKEGLSLKAIWSGSNDGIPFYFCLQKEDDCISDFVIYKGGDIGTFDFYPSRNDVIIVAQGSRLFVVELDKRAPQNIVELYKSETQDTLDFRVVDNETLVIKDSKKIIKLSLVYEG